MQIGEGMWRGYGYIKGGTEGNIYDRERLKDFFDDFDVRLQMGQPQGGE